MAGNAFFSPMSLLLLVMFAAAMVIMVRGLILRRRWVTHPSCGRCRYAVEGLDVLRCPECGADLTEVGILTPGMSRPLGPKAWAAVWTLGIPFPAFVATVMLWGLLPSSYLSAATLHLAPSDPAAPYENAVVDFVGQSNAVNKDLDTATVRLRMLDGTMSRAMEVELKSLDYRIQDADEQWHAGEDRLDEDELWGWLTVICGRDTRGDRQVEAAELLRQLEAMGKGNSVATGPAFTAASFSGSVTMVTNNWYWPVAGGVWFVIWLVGGLTFLRTG